MRRESKRWDGKKVKPSQLRNGRAPCSSLPLFLCPSVRRARHPTPTHSPRDPPPTSAPSFGDDATRDSGCCCCELSRPSVQLVLPLHHSSSRAANHGAPYAFHQLIAPPQLQRADCPHHRKGDEGESALVLTRSSSREAHTCPSLPPCPLCATSPLSYSLAHAAIRFDPSHPDKRHGQRRGRPKQGHGS